MNKDFQPMHLGPLNIAHYCLQVINQAAVMSAMYANKAMEPCIALQLVLAVNLLLASRHQDAESPHSCGTGRNLERVLDANM